MPEPNIEGICLMHIFAGKVPERGDPASLNANDLMVLRSMGVGYECERCSYGRNCSLYRPIYFKQLDSKD